MSPQKLTGMERREFLALCGAGGLTVLLPGQGHLSPAPAEAGSGSLSLMYWPANESFLSQVFSPPWNQAVTGGPGRQGELDSLASGLPALALAEGDPLFGSVGAKVHLQGVIPAGEQGYPRASITVWVDFIPFHDGRWIAWRYENRAALNIGGPVSFTAPISLDYGLNLRIRYAEYSPTSDPTGPSAWETPVRLDPGRRRGEAKLRRGVYAFPLAPGNLEAWPGRPLYLIPVEHPGGRPRISLSHHPADFIPVAFPHALLGIDYAEIPLSGNPPVA